MPLAARDGDVVVGGGKSARKSAQYRESRCPFAMLLASADLVRAIDDRCCRRNLHRQQLSGHVLVKAKFLRDQCVVPSRAAMMRFVGVRVPRNAAPLRAFNALAHVLLSLVPPSAIDVDMLALVTECRLLPWPFIEQRIAGGDDGQSRVLSRAVLVRNDADDRLGFLFDHLCRVDAASSGFTRFVDSRLDADDSPRSRSTLS